jgi:hypothetical protein
VCNKEGAKDHSLEDGQTSKMEVKIEIDTKNGATTEEAKGGYT